MNRLWSGLPAAVRGVLWMCSASLFFATGYIAVRELSANLSSFESVFYRCIMAVLFMLPWLMRSGTRVLRTRKLGLYVWRSIITYAGMVALFFGVAEMPLADATALLFTSPLFTVMIAALWLREPVAMRKWLAIAVGFAGALIIIRPGFVEISFAALAVLGTSISYAIGGAQTKALTATEDPNAVVFYMSRIMIPIAAVPAIYLWTTPTGTDWLWILMLGFSTYASQQSITRAFATAPTATVMPAFYVQLLFVAIFGFWIYDEVPDAFLWIGAAVICASTYYIAQRESSERNAT